MAVSGAVGRNKRDGNTALSVLLGTETNQFHQFHQFHLDVVAVREYNRSAEGGVSLRSLIDIS